MCGRFVLTSPAQVIAEVFGVDPPAELAPRWNVAPAQPLLVVRAGESPEPERVVHSLRWGLVPWWSKERPRGATMINARAETAPERPAFRDAFRRRRCLVPADGFYEWQAPAGGRASPKQPYLITLEAGGPFAFAALWDRWRPKDAGSPPLESCALLTTAPNALMRPIHDRMPVILPRSAWSGWLDPAVADVDRLRALLVPYPAGEMVATAVSPWVNDPRHDDPRCIEPA
jgi:putative SOS response-associated peptidase YedK